MTYVVVVVVVVVVYPPPPGARRWSDCPLPWYCSVPCGHSIVPAARPPSRGLSTNPRVTTLCVVFAVDNVCCMCVCVCLQRGQSGDGCL